LTSCVTFENRDLLIKLFCSLPKRIETPNAINSELEFHIKDVFPMDGLGLVVGGCAVSGRIQISEEQSQVFHIGPDRGKFIPVIIHSIQRQRYSVKNLHAGQSGTFGLKFYGPKSSIENLNEQSSEKTLATENFPPNFKIRRGQVIISQLKKPKCHWKFIADIYILSHTSCLMVGQDLKVYCGTISQMARVYEVPTKSGQPTEEQNGLDDMKSLELNLTNKKRRKCASNSGLIPGSRGKVTLKFLNEPEYLDVNSSVVIKGTGIKCVGRVVSLFENR
jgi:GTPase